MDDIRIMKTFFPESSADHWHRTLNVSTIQGGASVNQVPDHAEAVFDVRFTEHDDMDAVTASIRERIRGRTHRPVPWDTVQRG